KLRGGLEYLLDRRRRLALPARSDDEVIARLVPGGAAADVAVVERIAVVEHHRVVALSVHRRHGEDDRFRAKVQPCHRIGRIAVGRDDGGVLIREDSMLVRYLVERRLPLARVPVDDVVVHHRVVHHDRKAVDKPFLRDRLHFANVRGRHAGGYALLFGLTDRIVLLAASRKKRRGDTAQRESLLQSHPHVPLMAAKPSQKRGSAARTKTWRPRPARSSSGCRRRAAPRSALRSTARSHARLRRRRAPPP